MVDDCLLESIEVLDWKGVDQEIRIANRGIEIANHEKPQPRLDIWRQHRWLWGPYKWESFENKGWASNRSASVFLLHGQYQTWNRGGLTSVQIRRHEHSWAYWSHSRKAIREVQRGSKEPEQVMAKGKHWWREVDVWSWRFSYLSDCIP